MPWKPPSIIILDITLSQYTLFHKNLFTYIKGHVSMKRYSKSFFIYNSLYNIRVTSRRKGMKSHFLFLTPSIYIRVTNRWLNAESHFLFSSFQFSHIPQNPNARNPITKDSIKCSITKPKNVVIITSIISQGISFHKPTSANQNSNTNPIIPNIIIILTPHSLLCHVQCQHHHIMDLTSIM